MTRVLITGASGFIGQYLVRHFVDEKHEVWTIGIQEDGAKVASLPGVRSVCLDIGSEKLHLAVSEAAPEMVFHLAAQSYPMKSWKSPRLTIDTNIWGTHNLLTAVHKANPEAVVVLASSSAVYGSFPQEPLPVKEETPLVPLHPYGVSKLAMEAVARMFVQVNGLRCVIARIFNTIGPGKQGDVVGDFCTRLVVLEKAGGKHSTLNVGNLETKRAFVDVRDTVRALLLLADKGQPGEAYNISGPRAVTIEEILHILLKYVPGLIKIKKDASLFRPTEEPVIWGDNSKIRALDGWEAVIPLDETLREALEWWRNK